MHRFVWDTRYSTPPVWSSEYSMATVFGRNVPLEPRGPLALPGGYQVRLIVDGKSYMQPLQLVMDPRVKATAQDLEKQFALGLKLAQGLQQASQATQEIHEARGAGRINEDTERKLAGGEGRRGEADAGKQQVTLTQLSGTLTQILSVIDSADAAPTTQVSAAAEQTLTQLDALLKQWQAMKK